MHRITPSNPLPHPPCHGATGTTIGVQLAAANLSAPVPDFAVMEEHTVIAPDFGTVLADIKAADLSEAEQRAQTLLSVRNLLQKLGSLEIAEVLAVVDVLRAQCDGDSSMALQECGEALEGDLPAVQKVLRKIDVAEAAEAAYPQLVPLQACKGA
jgi:hypothetical protein